VKRYRTTEWTDDKEIEAILGGLGEVVLVIVDGGVTQFVWKVGGQMYLVNSTAFKNIVEA
jgi:hypothetical protein